MQYVLNGKEMKACDGATISHYGVPSLVLMERASLSVVEETLKRFPDAESFLIVCGSGNNGGDGIAVARLLFLKGFSVQIAFIGNREKASVETKTQLAIAEKYGIPAADEIPQSSYDVIFDSIFGIGLCREVGGRYYDVIAQMNAMSGKKVAIDIASGVNADNGHVLGIAFEADLTVSFGFPKIGHLLYPGASCTGELAVTEIGIDEWGFLDGKPPVRRLERSDLAQLPARFDHSNKGSYGKLLVIAGSVNMAGAACFSAAAAYRTGAGLVLVLTPEENRIIIQTKVPEAVLTTYQKDVFDAKQLAECMAWADVIILGPGIGTGKCAAQIVEYVLREADCPCVVDADALNLIARDHLSFENAEASFILTPHLGEMARLSGSSIPKIRESLIETAAAYAAAHGVVLVLKDSRTVTALADGTSYINTSGNHGMATGGSGDVLTGVIGGLLSQGCGPDPAAVLGVYLHGLSGDAAAAAAGKRSLTASDLISGISTVLSEAEEMKSA